ncbi:MAG: PLP-dependent transferase, partial [Myxococcota bacterium]
MDKRKYRPATLAVRGGQERSPHGEASEPIYTTAAFTYDSPETAAARFAGSDEGFVYSRYGNPTTRAFENRLRLLEGAEDCRSTASGMAAVSSSLFSWLRQGDHVVAARALFGSCRHILESILPRFGVECTLIDGARLDAWREAIRPETVAFFFESPSNPLLELVDISGVAEIAREATRSGRARGRIRVMLDNVFATPVLQRPLEHGADVVIYSATKHIDGQGRVLGGAVLGDMEYIDGELQPFLRNTGPAMSPFNAWVLLKSLETMELRVHRQCDSAEKICSASQSQI